MYATQMLIFSKMQQHTDSEPAAPLGYLVGLAILIGVVMHFFKATPTKRSGATHVDTERGRRLTINDEDGFLSEEYLDRRRPKSQQRRA